MRRLVLARDPLLRRLVRHVLRARLDLVLARLVGVGHRLRDEAGHEGHHHHAAVGLDAGEDGVGHVARHVVQRPRGGMREDDGRLRDAQRVVHRLRRDVRQVDQHAQPVHLTHDFLAEAREPAVGGGAGGAVRPVQGHVVRERHVAHAQVVVRAQRAQRVLDGVAALDPERGPDLPRPQRLLHIVRGQRPDELRVARDDLPRDVDLLELDPRVVLELRLARRVDGPELSAQVAGLDAREIGVAGRARAQVVGGDVARRRRALADGPGQVVVTVDDGMRREHGARVRQRGVVRGAQRRGHEQDESEQPTGHRPSGRSKKEDRYVSASPPPGMGRGRPTSGHTGPWRAPPHLS